MSSLAKCGSAVGWPWVIARRGSAVVRLRLRRMLAAGGGGWWVCRLDNSTYVLVSGSAYSLGRAYTSRLRYGRISIRSFGLSEVNLRLGRPYLI